MVFFFFNDTATTEIYTLSLHDALPIWLISRIRSILTRERTMQPSEALAAPDRPVRAPCGTTGTRKTVAVRDRKSTRLNSSHSQISYAVFCLKKKKQIY